MTHPYQEDSRDEALKARDEIIAKLKQSNEALIKDRQYWMHECDQARDRTEKAKEATRKVGLWKYLTAGVVAMVFLFTFGRGCGEATFAATTARETSIANNCERVCSLYHMEVMTCREQWVSCIDDTHLEGYNF